MQKLQLPPTFWDNSKKTNRTQNKELPPLSAALLQLSPANPTAWLNKHVIHKQQVWLRGWRLPTIRAAPPAPQRTDWAHGSQLQQYPAHADCGCEKWLVTACARGWVKKFLFWQERNCSGACTGERDLAEKRTHFGGRKIRTFQQHIISWNFPELLPFFLCSATLIK